MNLRRAPFLLLAFGVSSLLSGVSVAHERKFTHSRDWHLPYRGEHEFELRSFFDTSHGEYRGQFEYEYGITDSFAFEPGFEVKENEDGDYEIEALDAELRFHFGTYRRNAWLPALNLEYEHPLEDEEADRLELKGVLSRYGESDDFTLNLNYGREIEGDRQDESELTAGWLHSFWDEDEGSEEASSLPKFGLELVQDFEEHHLRAGPLVTWRASRHLNILASYLPAIDDRGAGNFDELTLILEWEL